MTHTHTTARPVSIIVEVVHGISICSPMFTELQERETLAEHAKRGDVVAVYVVELTSLDVPALRSSWRERRGLALVESANAPTLAERRAGHALPESQRNRAPVSAYNFAAYDVLQAKRAGEWLDFSTIRTEDEGTAAAELVECGMWDGKSLAFRITNGRGMVKFSK